MMTAVSCLGRLFLSPSGAPLVEGFSGRTGHLTAQHLHSASLRHALNRRLLPACQGPEPPYYSIARGYARDLSLFGGGGTTVRGRARPVHKGGRRGEGRQAGGRQE